MPNPYNHDDKECYEEPMGIPSEIVEGIDDWLLGESLIKENEDE